jgi:hypothetical protein
MAARLTPQEIDSFVRDGFVCVPAAFSRETAEEGRALLWAEMGLSATDPTGWTQPVVRLQGSGAPPFARAAKAARLLQAFDQLVGEKRWIPRTGLGTFPIRFPVPSEPDDTGWHCDGSFGDWPYRLNVHSRDRALLMLFLFSDVSEADAPTRIRVGSHLDVPRLLAPSGEEGLTFLELAPHLQATATRPVVTATGSAGDVYLCHPFLVHAAQSHAGTMPRFLAQPSLAPIGELEIDRPGHLYSPVETAIRIGLGLE